jgi:hypothetical protein
MTHRLRRAGHIRLSDGRAATWTVAEGTRGRRWREVVVAGEGTGSGERSIVHSLLLEIDPDGRFAHLELSVPAGLLTLHPEGDGTLHGNAVTERGVEHVRGLRWSAGAIVVIGGSLISRLAALPLLATVVPVRSSASVPALAIASDLRSRAFNEEVRRGDDGGSWSFGGGESIVVDEDGLPETSGATHWPLEVPAEAETGPAKAP